MGRSCPVGTIAAAILSTAAGVAVPAFAAVDTPPSANAPQYVANAPGTYTLNRIQRAGDGWVLEGNWLPRRLSGYLRGRVTLMSFMYTYCSDPDGCPLAYRTFVAVKERVAADPSLRGKVRLVSLSFDPTHDSPSAMHDYGAGHAADGAVQWHFLTTYSMRTLAPILDSFGQDVEVEIDEEGTPTRAITHLLKVFLVDRDGMVREIYGLPSLTPDVLVNDIKTLLIESSSRAAPVARP